MAIPAKNNDNNDENEKNSTTHSNPNFNRNNFALLLFKVFKITQRKIKITNHNLSQTKQKLNKALSNTWYIIMMVKLCIRSITELQTYRILVKEDRGKR